MRHRILLVLAVFVFIAANTWNALNKGGDAQVFFEGGRRLLQARPLYEGSSPASGFIGPPFQAAFFLPFSAVANVSDASARLLWYVLNLAALGFGVRFWVRAWTASRAGSPLAHLEPQHGLWFAAFAILLPLQTNFEHQNMNALLLGASGFTAYALVRHRWQAAGALIGFAAALKIFPALAILYVAARGWWRCAAVSVVTCAVLTVLPAAVYGRGFAPQVKSWLQIASGGWPVRGQNQSLMAAIDRALPGGPEAGIHNAQQVPAEFAIFALSVVALVVVALLVTRCRRPEPPQVPCELAAVTLLSILLSPVAWDHYWVLLFPAFMLTFDARDKRLLGTRASVLFWTAALLTSGLSRATLGVSGWALARALSVNTVAALILYGALSAIWSRLHKAAASP
jgi:alpha-1,2-mannosyltransferase